MRSASSSVQELFLTETARLAEVVLPAQAFSEREGSYTNGERRVQRFYPGVPPGPQVRADFTITAQIGPAPGSGPGRPLGRAGHAPDCRRRSPIMPA